MCLISSTLTVGCLLGRCYCLASMLLLLIVVECCCCCRSVVGYVQLQQTKGRFVNKAFILVHIHP